jgi:hypothetical protein
MRANAWRYDGAARVELPKGRYKPSQIDNAQPPSRQRHRKSGGVFRESNCGIPLLIFGALWLAETVGLVQAAQFWPLTMTLVGAWMLIVGSICGVPMTVMGSLWLLATFGLFEEACFWPLAVIAIGAWWVVAELLKQRANTRRL